MLHILLIKIAYCILKIWACYQISTAKKRNINLKGSLQPHLLLFITYLGAGGNLNHWQPKLLQY